MKKKLTKKLLFELLKDSKRSDRELAKVLRVSQPTITRRRNKLVDEGMIQEFTIIPDFTKMGYEIMAISCFKSKVREELAEKAKNVTMSLPNVVFAARWQGMEHRQRRHHPGSLGCRDHSRDGARSGRALPGP